MVIPLFIKRYNDAFGRIVGTDIVKHVVENSEDVVVLVKKDGNKTTLEIKVHVKDRGRIIGKEGRTIKAIRALISVVVPDGRDIAVEVLK